MRVTFKIQKVSDHYIVVMNFNHNAGRFRKSMGIKLNNPNEWNVAKMRLTAKHKYQSEYNRLLDINERSVLDAYNKSLADGIDLTDMMLNQAMGKLKSKRRAAQTFDDFFLEFIKGRKEAGLYHSYTIKHYQMCYNALQEAFKKVNWGDINYDLIERFDKFLITDRHQADNTRTKMIKILYAIINAAKRKGYGVNPNYRDFKVKYGMSHNIYLTLQELEILNAHKYSLPMYRNAVDIFLIGCYTGMRYSDFSLMKIENIQEVRGVQLINVRQSKTVGDVTIPVHRVVKEILSRNGGMPRMISSQNLNDYIKIACREAKITQKIVHYYNKAGRNVSEVVEKCELVSSHTARRSCATNMHIMGVDHKLIMKITGHQKESTFMRYLCIDREDSALLLAKSSFFN